MPYLTKLVPLLLLLLILLLLLLLLNPRWYGIALSVSMLPMLSMLSLWKKVALLSLSMLGIRARWQRR